MKCFWQTCMAVVVTAAMANAANAQWDEPARIGSYQSILARAGYGDPYGSQTNGAVPASYRTTQSATVTAGTAIAPAQMGVQVDNGAITGQMPGRDGVVSTDGYGNGSYLDSNSGDAGCGAPVYSPEKSVCGGENANWVLGVYGLSFRRDYDDGQRLACNAAGDVLYSDDVTNGNMNGLAFSIAKRGCSGSGWEAIFWGVDEESDVTLDGTTSTHLYGLGAVSHPPSGATVQDIYDSGDRTRVFRDTDIYNFEFNLLRNGGQYTTRFGRCATYELLGGFRLFDFDESLRDVSYSSSAAYPATIEYSLEAENTLVGFQLGGRSEICLSDRFRLAYAGTAGIFNNHIETRQQIVDSDSYWAMDYSDTKNDAAVLGQIDLGLIYQFSCNARARIGYRAMGIAGVALADDQIPRDFTDTRALGSANSNGDLLLYGFYYGGEFCF